MNQEQAKYILQAWRGAECDEITPEIREALAMLESNPELTHWWAREQEFDQLMEKTVAGITVPADLKERILEQSNELNQNRVLTFPRLLAYAASLIVILGLAFLVLEPVTMEAEADVYQFLEQVPEWMENGTPPEKSSEDLKVLLKHLRIDDITLPDEIVHRYGHLQPYGAHIKNWHKKRVGVIHLRDVAERDYRLFMIATGVFTPEKKITEQPSPRVIDNQTVLAWRDENLYYAFTEK